MTVGEGEGEEEGEEELSPSQEVHVADAEEHKQGWVRRGRPYSATFCMWSCGPLINATRITAIGKH